MEDQRRKKKRNDEIKNNKKVKIMFGNQNMKDMMSKLQEMQGVVKDSKKRLENIYVKGDALNGKIRFVLDGNRKLKELFIDEEVYESLEKDSLIEAILYILVFFEVILLFKLPGY